MLGMVIFLIVFPFVCAGVLALMRKSGPYRKYTLFTFCAIIAVVDIYFIIQSLMVDQTQEYLVETHDRGMGIVYFNHIFQCEA